MNNDLPMPPLEMRRLVGLTDEAAFDNPAGELTLPGVEAAQYAHVLDFGSGCGRIARRLIQQRPQPSSYLGLDIHRGMVDWCARNLTPHAPHFRFAHLDAFNPGLNPSGTKAPLPFPAPDATFTLINAWSVFTHIVEPDVPHYLREARRVLRDDGVLFSTWFGMDKQYFPMLQDFQNALYINLDDPTNAVIFDRQWIRRQFAAVGLRIVRITPPKVRGFAWILHATPRTDVPEVAFPVDEAPFGDRRPPLGDRPATDVR